jgi:site-specific DNA-cytosine methylase
LGDIRTTQAVVQPVQQFVTQDEIAGPLDSHYFKGPGSRAGGEREYVAHITIDPTLAASNDPARVQTSNIQHFDVYNHRLTGDLAGIVREQHGTNMNAVFQPGMVVRRLTPTECERLQGFPDAWTLIRYRGKPSADAPRYKALGNSMAVPVIRWLGQQIMKATNEKETEC